MTVDATASALAASEAVESAPVEMTEDQQMVEIYDRLTSEEPVEDAPAPEPEVAEPEPTEDAAEPAEPGEDAPPEVPSGLPSALKDAWGGMSEAARAAVLADRDGLHRKLSDMGRQVQGISPIRDVLVDAVEKLPALSGMTPDAVAREVFELAQMSQKFNSDPVNTMLGLVKKHGLEQAMSQALAGRDVSEDARGTADLKNEIASLNRKLAQVSDPEYIRQHVAQFTSVDRVASDVEQFAAKAEHWAALENEIPNFIPLAQQKLGDGAAPGAVLEAAYNMALKINDLDTKAPTPPAEEAKAIPDPERTKAAIQAKSVNVSGKTSGKQRDLTEDELLASIYSRAHQS